MKTKRAAAFLLCVCLILCLLPSLSASRAFDGVAFLVVNNTLLRPMKAETMPVFIGKEVFVPYSVLDRLSSVKYKYEPHKEKLTLYNDDSFLVFDMALSRTYDETGAEYKFGANYINNTVYIPVDTTCEKFGLYHSVSILSILSPMVRIHEGELIGSDVDFTARLYSLFNTTYEDFVSTVDLPLSHNVYTPSQRAAYLLFFGDPAQASRLLDELKVPACFFLTADEICENGGFVRRLVSEGHSVGLMLDPAASDSLTVQYREANDALRLQCNLISRIVSLKNGSGSLSEDQETELSRLGCSLWDTAATDDGTPIFVFGLDGQSVQQAIEFAASAPYTMMPIYDWTRGYNEAGIY